MLNWLTGAAEGQNDVGEDTRDAQADTFDDAPETPAPVFAVRAFKQALFGTPKPEDADKLRARAAPPRRRPQQISRSVANANKTQARANGACHISPSKRPGILLTPGTERSRHKTVAFGTHVASNPQSGFQARSPGAATTRLSGQTDRLSARNLAIGNGPSGSSNASLPVIESDAELHGSGTRNTGAAQDTTPERKPLGKSVRQSTSDSHGEEEVEGFSRMSILEMRKLAKKEQVAKKFAKHKEAEVVELVNMLRREQQKVEQLEGQVEQYVAQLSSMANVEGGCGATHRDNAEQTKLDDTDRQLDVIGLRATIQRQQSQLNDANKTIASLRSRNADIEKALTELRLSSEKPTVSTSAGHEPYEEHSTSRQDVLESRKSRGAQKRQKDHPGSDIWADVSGANVNQQALSASEQNIKPVLDEISGNVQISGPNNEKADGQKMRMSAAQIAIVQQRLAAKRARGKSK